jgi:peptide/nickel transport system substrate-binding protein
MRFNFLHPPFNNKQIRTAAMYAVGQEDILKAIAGDPKYYRTCVAIFGCGNPYEFSYKEEMLVPSNIEQAKKILQEAKYDGTPVVILHPTDNSQVTTQPVVIADALRKAGFNVDLQSMDWQTLTTRRASKNPPAQGGWNIHATNGPLVGITDPLRSQAVATSGDRAWFGWPDFPDIEELRQQFALATDEQEKKEIARKIQERVIDEGVAVPLGQTVIPTAYSKKLKGVQPSPLAVFWGIEKSAN